MTNVSIIMIKLGKSVVTNLSNNKLVIHVSVILPKVRKDVSH